MGTNDTNNKTLPGSKGILRRMLLTIVGVYVACCLFVCLSQRQLIYFPTRIPAEVVVKVGADHGFLPWHNVRDEIIGWKIPASGMATGSVMIMHGNAGCAVGRDYIARPIHEAGAMDVYVLEYPGYGGRPGAPNKISMVAAAEEAFHLLPGKLPKYLVSESIGAGVACEMARRHPDEVAGMALLVPYDNLASVAQRHMWFLPAYFFLLDRFNPAACLKNYHGPVKFAVAGADEIIGPEAGRRLANGYSGRKELQVFPGAGHNEISAQPAEWWQGVFQFWKAGK